MPRTVQFNGVTQQFPDDATDDEIRSALESLDKPEPKTLGGFGRNVLSSGGKFLGDMVQGVDALAGAGVGAVLDLPGTIKGIGESHPLDAIGRMKDFYKQRYSPDKIIDTLYEDPVGVASDVATVATGVGGVAKGAAKLAGLSKVPMAGKGLNAVAKGASAVETATNPLNVTKLPWVAARKIKPVDKALNARGRKLYEEGLKIPPGGSVAPDSRNAMVTMGINQLKAPQNERGLAKVNAGIQNIEDTVKPAAKQGAAQGMTVSPTDVADRIDPVKPRFDTVNPVSDRSALEAAKEEFLGEHTYQAPFTPGAATPGGFKPSKPAVQPGPLGNPIPVPGQAPGTSSTAVNIPIPVDEALRIKSNTYRRMKDAAYGEQKAPSTEGMKALARGLNEDVLSQLEQIVPGISKLGPQEKVMIDLREQFEKFLMREGNKQTVPLAVAASHTAPAALLLKFLDYNPALKSRIAIAMANRGQAPGKILQTTDTLKRLGNPMATYGRTRLGITGVGADEQ